MLSQIELLAAACTKLDKQGLAVLPKRCLRSRHLQSTCRVCSSACPNDAISCEEGLNLTPEKCTGCGACTAVCPSGALAAKLPSNQEVHPLVAAHVERSGAVAFACETYLSAHPDERQRVIAVPCIVRCDESVLVDAVLRGAASVTLINAACADCRQNKVCEQARTTADTAKRLLESWNYPAVFMLSPVIPATVKALPKPGNVAGGMSRRNFLTAFTRKSESLATQMLPEIISAAVNNNPDNTDELANPMEEPKHLPAKWCSLRQSIRQIPAAPVIDDFPSSLWGDICIAASCNGCGACVEACPTAAIVAFRQEGKWGISLDISLCTQCGLCKDICCGESITMESTVRLTAVLDSSPRVLIEKELTELDNLLEAPEQRITRLLGCAVKY
ncbi:MAG TPA: 4Fe-4S binding protein [Patescibacteria group bacterium]|nr:4Fe-4S binding protein [Patescibacteria group bacterium]